MTLLGLTPKDIDFVAVGTTRETFLELGFRQVGQDFPVFLHPENQAEIALARTERKTKKGHKGFVVHADPSVALEPTFYAAILRSMRWLITNRGSC